MKRGLATTFLSTITPTAVMASLAKSVYAASCPAPNRMAGGLVQLYRNGGCAMGATFLNATQAGFMNSSIAADYGILGTGLTQAGSNWWVDPTSPFGMAVLTPPPGWAGSQSWAAALKNTALGAHYGQFHSDDAVGNSEGQNAGCGGMKPSYSSIDVALNTNGPRSNWAKPFPAFRPKPSLSNLTPTVIQSGFSMMPSSGINSSTLMNAANATDAMSQAFMSLFSSGRTNAQQAYTNAICGFMGDGTIADPTFAGTYFNPAGISQLTGAIPNLGTTLSAEMQAFLVAFYQSAMGNIGGVLIEQGGCDYHPPQPQTNAAPLDYEAGQIFAMWLAAAVAANAKSTFIMNSNGRVHCSGITSNTFTPTGYGGQVTVNGPTSAGDAGGSYNAGLLVIYDPKAAPSGLTFTGTFNNTTGAVTASSSVPSVPAALAGLYLTALDYMGFNVTNAAALITANGLPNPCSYMLLGTC